MGAIIGIHFDVVDVLYVLVCEPELFLKKFVTSKISVIDFLHCAEKLQKIHITKNLMPIQPRDTGRSAVHPIRLHRKFESFHQFLFSHLASFFE